MMRLSLLVLTLVLPLIAAAQPEHRFRAGAATANITPWLGLSLAGNMTDQVARFIHDELHVRALVLDDGENRLAFAVVDSCMVPRELVDSAKRRAADLTSIPVHNMLVSATHSHTAACATGVFQSQPDPDYQQFLARRIADAIASASDRLAPARIGHGRAELPGEVFNRRWHMKPGTVPPNPFGETSDQVQMNPPRASENLIEPAGPIDPEIAFIVVQDLAGKPVALLANYSLHYVGGVGPGHVSADYFALFASRIGALLDAPDTFVGIMTNGTSGDINNINFREPATPRQPYEQMQHVADRAAEAVFEALPPISFEDWVPLRSVQEEIELGVRRPAPDEVETARTILGEPPWENLSGLQAIYARETVLLSEYPEQVRLVLQALGIGELAIAAIPCEVFVDIGLQIKRESPFAQTFTIELANGYNGYLPTAAQHALGGYETWRARSSYLEVDAAEKIASAVLKLIHQLHAERE